MSLLSFSRAKRVENLLWVVAFVPALALSRAAAQEPFPGLDAYVTRALQASKVPGIGVAIVRNDSVLYTKGYGVLVVGSTTAVDDQTLFEIGSSSKAFTATLAAMMVSDGKMRYDDRVNQYLPDFKLYDPVASAELTVRDALTHRGGLSRGELVWLGSGANREEVLHRIRFLKPQSPFRSRYSYQNVMVLAAGQAVGKAAGSTWDELLKQRIFIPLGMRSSLGSLTLVTSRNFATPHGMTRDSVSVKPHGNMDNIGPAGSIISNARDMAQWLRFQLADGVYNGKRLVSSAALRETHTPQMLMGGGGGGRGGAADSVPPVTRFSTYGMGWIVEDYRQQLMWQHGGNTDGMTAAVGMLPEHKLGVVVLSNMASAQLPAQLMHYIFDRQLNVPTREIAARGRGGRGGQADSSTVVQAGARTGGESPIPLSAFVGSYADSLYGEATVTLESGHLQFKRGEWYGPLEYWNATNFRWTISPSSPTGPMYIKFEVSPDNQVMGLYFGLAGDQTLLGKKGAGGGRGRGRGGM